MKKVNLEKRLKRRDIIRDKTEGICTSYVSQLIQVESFEAFKEMMTHQTPENYLKEGEDLGGVLWEFFEEDRPGIKAYVKSRNFIQWFNKRGKSELDMLQLFEKIQGLPEAGYKDLPTWPNWEEIIKVWIDSKLISRDELREVVGKLLVHVFSNMGRNSHVGHQLGMLYWEKLYPSKANWQGLKVYTEAIGDHLLDNGISRYNGLFTYDTYRFLVELGSEGLNINAKTFEEKMLKFQEGLITQFSEKFESIEEYDYQDDEFFSENYF